MMELPVDGDAAMDREFLLRVMTLPQNVRNEIRPILDRLATADPAETLQALAECRGMISASLGKAP